MLMEHSISNVTGPEMQPLLLDDVILSLADTYHNGLGKSLPPGFPALFKKMADNAVKNKETTRELNEFISAKKSEKKLHKHSVEIPAGILHKNLDAHLHDIKIHTRGPDDTIYRQHPDIRSKIPRGVTILEFKGGDCDTVIYGFKKFTGGIGDEDETQPETNDQWQDYCIADHTTAKQLVCMDKLNGEAAHFSGRYIQGQFYLFVGSKNVHMMIREKGDINQYDGPRYFYAKIIAESVCDTLNQLKNKEQNLLYSFLHHTKCTVVGEILQPENQHIVNLSHLEKPSLHVISFTSTLIDDDTSLTALPPHHCLDLAQALGFNAAHYTIIDFAVYAERRLKIRSTTQKEGEVWYLLNEEDQTIGLIKIKTTWYILLRALREKAVYSFSNAKKKPGWNHIRATHKRFGEIQDWLKFSKAYLDQWKTLAEKFLNWLNLEVNKLRIPAKDIRPKFPRIWKQFLIDTHETDEFVLT